MKHFMRFLFIVVFIFGLGSTPPSAYAVNLKLEEILQQVPEGLGLIPFDYVAYKGLYSTTTRTGFISFTQIVATNYCPLPVEAGKRPKFSPDLDLMGEDLVVHEDYANHDGLDRGHLTSNGIFKTRDEANRTFFLTNVAPQYVAFNGGIWRRMEHCAKLMIDYSCRNQVNWGIITGIVPSNPSDPNTKILNNKVVVPQYFYKIIFTLDTKRPFIFAYVMPNSPTIHSKDSLRTYQKSLKDVEELTGVKFFSEGVRAQINLEKVEAIPFGTQTCVMDPEKRDRALELGILSMINNLKAN